jgi:hypothetical protein
MKKLFKIEMMVVALLIFTGGVMYGQGRGRATSPGTYCANIPNLTEAQSSALKALAEAHRAEMDLLRIERRSGDRATWSSAGEKMGALTQKHLSDIGNILTDEQKSVFTPRGAGNRGPVGVMNGTGPGRRIGDGSMAARGDRRAAAPIRRGGGRGWR